MENKRLSNNWVSEDRFEHRMEAQRVLDREKKRRKGWKTALMRVDKFTFIERRVL